MPTVQIALQDTGLSAFVQLTLDPWLPLKFLILLQSESSGPWYVTAVTMPEVLTLLDLSQLRYPAWAQE